MKRALFIASWDIGHVRALLKNLGQRIGEEVRIDAFDTSRNTSEKRVDSIHATYHIRYGEWSKRFWSVRKIGVIAHYISLFKTLKSILSQNQYDYAAIVSLPVNTWFFVWLLHRNHIKVHLVPIGSDILRINWFQKLLLKIAFKNADLVNCGRGNAVGEMVFNTFKVPQNKQVLCGFGSDVITALNNYERNTRSKAEIAQALGIPEGEYIIGCGYAGNREQRHSEMLKAIAANKELLPPNYQIVVQLTYGSDKDKLYNELRDLAQDLQLNVVFLRNYLSVEAIVMLRNYVDLFIHVQTTDGYNFSLQEYLLAGTQCINGAWLEYPKLEQTRPPYFKCDDIEGLPILLRDIFTNKLSAINLPQDTRKEIVRRDWDIVSISWKNVIEMT